MNHAENCYGLKRSPMKDLRKIDRKNAGEMRFWTKTEYLNFSRQVEDDPVAHCAFEILYWCGLCLGELLIDLGFPAPAIAERIGHSSI